MIDNTQELAASLHYIQGWADLLEGLRQTAKETNDTTLLPLTTEGPISEIRRVLAEASVYVQSLGEEAETGDLLLLNGARGKAA